MKTKQLIKHSVLFIVAFAAFGLSIIAAVNLADYKINSTISAIWVFIYLAVSLAGLITLPVFMISSLMRIVTIVMQPVMKRKNTSTKAIAS